MKRRWINVLLIIIVFILGFLTSRFIENSDNYSTNSQNSLINNSEKRILTNRIIHNIIQTGRVIDNSNIQKIPSDYLNDDDILVYNNKIILKINNAQISNYESDSMEPFLGQGANGIVVKPETEKDINTGDIITFRRNDKLVVHRVIEKGIDERGVYFITKGDNSDIVDGKIRFEEIEHKLVGIVY